MLHEIDYYILNDYMEQNNELIFDDNLTDKMTNNNDMILFVMMIWERIVDKLGILNI
jgi:hypothetical protein